MNNLVVKYLSDRLGKVVLNTKKRQAYGPLYLVHLLQDNDTIYEEDLHKLVSIATNIILHKSANDPSGKKGEALLTHTAISIGLEVANFKGCDLTKEQMLHIGDLFVEAFYHAGFIEVSIQDGFAPKSGSPYVLTVTEKFSEMVKTQPAKSLLLYTVDTPIPPITGILQGNNYAVVKGINSETVKQPLITHQNAFKESIERGDAWVKAVDKIQQQPWMINKELLNVISNNLPSILPPKQKRLNKYNKVEINNAYKALQKDPSDANKEAYNKASERWNQELCILRDISKRAELETIYRKALALSSYDAFYQYVDVDYRGRVYYKEPFFNYQGSDMAKALFLFEDSVKLTEKGLRWIYIHTACCYNESYEVDSIPEWCEYDYTSHLKREGLDSISVDKMTLNDRVKWTEMNLTFIYKSIDTIHACEKPFSFLACCIELNNIRLAKFKGEDYYTHLPVPVDGSCNGYQHSAAIAKDELTGKLVSLLPTEIPSDLYVESAKCLIERELEWFNKRDMPMKHIRKYITKRGTMTRQYSAGADKIADSMYSDAYTGGITDEYDISMVDCECLSKSLVKALEDVCPGANNTMSFLQSLVNYEIGKTSAYDIDGSNWTHTKKKKVHARKQELKRKKDRTVDEDLELALIDQRLAHVKKTRYVSYGNGKTHMEWVSPSNFPVFYHSYLTREFNVYVTLAGVPVGHKKDGEFSGRITHVLQEPSTYASLQGLMSGISPNYIHSQDAAHMALVLNDWSYSFGAVHDSFSTHAEHVDELTSITKEKFINMYSSDNCFIDIMNNVLSDATGFDKPLPELGNLDINELTNSEYFFC